MKWVGIHIRDNASEMGDGIGKPMLIFGGILNLANAWSGLYKVNSYSAIHNGHYQDCGIHKIVNFYVDIYNRVNM